MTEYQKLVLEYVRLLGERNFTGCDILENTQGA